jgi:hypothetical protein
MRYFAGSAKGSISKQISAAVKIGGVDLAEPLGNRTFDEIHSRARRKSGDFLS